MEFFLKSVFKGVIKYMFGQVISKGAGVTFDLTFFDNSKVIDFDD